MNYFVIPTNRDIKLSLTSVLREMEYLKGKLHDSILIIVDNSEENVMKLNSLYIKQLDAKNVILHYTLQRQMHLIQHISKAIHVPFDELCELLLPQNCDYGKIFNMIYIIITSIGGNTFFRRDSDCHTTGFNINEFPIVYEDMLLGQNIKEIEHLISYSNCNNYNKNDKVFIVGSDYYGNWNLDVEDLQNEDINVLYKIYKLSNFDEQDIRKVIDIKYLNREKYFIEKPALDCGIAEYQWPEAGNISMYEVFKWIPNFIGKNAIGFDYHTYNMAYCFNLATIFHPNKINHTHTAERKSFDMQLAYWRGILKLNDYNYFLRVFSNIYFKNERSNYNFNVLKKSVMDNSIYYGYLGTLGSLSMSKRIDIFNSIVLGILKNSKINMYKRLSTILIKEQSNLLTEINNDYLLSIKLHKIWRNIIESFKY